MSTPSLIVAATQEDFADIRRLLGEAGLPVEDLRREHLRQFLVARVENRLTGVIGLEAYNAIGLLRSLVVAPESRKHGLGQQLVRELEAKARDIGVRELWLLTIDADLFFRRLGYLVSDRSEAPAAVAATHEFAGLCPDDAVLMRKSLSVG
jgi:amino-acid N-acetyltransferase